MFQLGRYDDLLARPACPLRAMACDLIPRPNRPGLVYRLSSSVSSRIKFHLLDDAGRNYGSLAQLSFLDEDLTCPLSVPLDPSNLGKWIAECEADHDTARAGVSTPNGSIETQPTPIDITLIDVVDRCLVRASTKHRYLALSYVWGGQNGLSLNVSNRQALEQPGSLLSRKAEIPRLIQNSMDLVLAMAERYLWVDSLCIEQDNPLQKHFNISRMDTVYNRCLATISALSARHANSRLPGLGRHLRISVPAEKRMLKLSGAPRAASASGLRSTEIHMVMRPPSLHTELLQSVYETRAWTLQERLLSRRCIFLTEHAAYFYCKAHGVLSSDRPPHPDDSELRPPSSRRSWPSATLSVVLDPLRDRDAVTEQHLQFLGCYAATVHLYTARELGFSVDGLNAFSGILSALNKEFGGVGSVGGLPEYLLDHCLLWDHDAPGDGGLPTPTRRAEFPSWSWAGWSGRKTYFNGPLFLDSAAEFISRRCPEKRLVSELQDLRAFSETPKRVIRRYREASDEVDSNGTAPSKPFARLPRDVLDFRAEICSGPDAFFPLPSIQPLVPQRVEARSLLAGCGIVYSLVPPDAQKTGSFDCMLLSTSPCPFHKNSALWSDVWRDFHPNKERGELPLMRDCFLGHLMLVKWNEDGRAERVGLASIRMDVWKRLARTKKHITLV